MSDELERALLLNIRGALGLSRDLTGHEAKRILRVVLYTLKRDGYAISRAFAPRPVLDLIAESPDPQGLSEQFAASAT